MDVKIKVGIVGYGNLGKGVHYAIKQNPDIELTGVFTRRNPENVSLISDDAKAYKIDDLVNFKDKIDVLILCGGSATDLPVQGPEFISMFNTVDSFDTHAKIPEYFNTINENAIASGKTGIISIGWDPGLFSICRMMFGAMLPEGKDFTFWGKGVSQGHSDAIRRIEGVKNAIQYTIPIKEAIDNARKASNAELTTREKHIRECFVVACEGADLEKIRYEIISMPNYFVDYDTNVTFISEEELLKNHSGMPHGGFVIRTGKTGKDSANKHVMELSIKLDSNPEFTSSILVAYARAAYRLNKEGKFGAFSILDIPVSYISPKPVDVLRKELL